MALAADANVAPEEALVRFRGLREGCSSGSADRGPSYRAALDAVSPKGRLHGRQLDRPPNNSNFSVMVVLPPSGCEMIAKVRRPAISSVRVLVNWVQLLPDGAVAGKRSRRPE